MSLANVDRGESRAVAGPGNTINIELSVDEIQQLAHVISHDLPAPLRAVEGYSRLLQDKLAGAADAEANEYLAGITAGARRMRAIINGLVEYLRVSSDGKPLAPVDCNVVLDRAKADLKEVLDACDATLTRDPLPIVLGDASQLVGVFQRLIHNAVVYRGNEPPKIHVSVRSHDDGWLFSVRDNGLGMDPKDCQRIFALIRRLHTQEEIPGAGAGLAICKRVLQRHDGRIWVESQPGEGSTFYLTLPPAAADATASNSSS